MTGRRPKQHALLATRGCVLSAGVHNRSVFGVSPAGWGALVFALAVVCLVTPRMRSALGADGSVPPTEVPVVAERPGTSRDRSAATDDDVAFFEEKVWPLLQARCLSCHGSQVKEPKGGLRLDARAAILAGGESGPAAVPGKPDESLIISAVRYESFEMPPRSRLPEGEIRILSEWIRRGLPWSNKVRTAAPPSRKPKKFPLAERVRSHWAWAPIHRPDIPQVRNTAWPLNAIDRFVLACLEQSGLRPAPQADRATLLRRASFVITGLPPSPEQVEAFVHDPRPTQDAFAEVVDHLLESPHFGEHWARHWLDLVRYAETLGHEFDYPIPHAWQYRDYVIRAFQQDVPYDQFLREHVAGDLLPHPRRHPTEGFNESIIGTAFWFLGEGKHAPVDVRKEETDRIDNQLDVFSKTFLALTVACARCHDHKFDAITSRDYYALAGFIKSTRRQTAYLDPHGRIATAQQRVLDGRRKAMQLWARSSIQPDTAASLARILLAADQVVAGASTPAAAAERFRLPEQVIERWAATLKDRQSDHPSHPLFVWRRVIGNSGDASPEQLADRWQQLQAELDQYRRRREEALRQTELLADFDDGFDGWFRSGPAFANTGPAPQPTAEPLHAGHAAAPPGVVHSGLNGRKLCGALRSPDFIITKPTILYRVAGENARIHIVIDGYGFDVFNALLFRGANINVKTGGDFQWIRQAQDVSRYVGHRAYIELIDDGDGWLAVDEIRLADARQAPPQPPATISLALAAGDPPRSARELAERFAALAARGFRELADQWIQPSPAATSPERSATDASSGRIEDAARALAAALVERSLWPAGDAAFEAQWSRLLERSLRAAGEIPAPMRVPAAADGTGTDEFFLIRGNAHNAGEPVPRHFLEAISGPDQPRLKPEDGSGRLILAERMLDERNPFPARVMVNRVWHHVFGRGIVPTVDNFGVLGQPPTHPELLDYLADEFRRDGWSIKRLIRRMILSRTWQQATKGDPAAEAADPTNRLWHRALVRRLSGESIRDAILAVSGRLDPKQYGPPVPIHLTPFMQGRGRPRRSGPLDGNGRRSIYIEVRRNFLSPFFLAFDTPIPFTTIGRRNVSNVPAQALILLNDPFVVQQAELWGQRVAALGSLPLADRIDRMYLRAFARRPTADERAAAEEFLREQAARFGLSDAQLAADPRPWKELAHVLFNAKEFWFLR
ncbi:MAG: DUF1553 domain-containing protein [Planctomycetota bacterium]|nr:MAG: DUF1553 domain-containing protein [Planctomycetota bacterium]